MSPILEGVSLFNAGQFWEAHEAWEARWLQSDGDEKRFLQGLIQLAAAYHHVQRGTLSGGLRLFASSREKLHKFRDGFLDVEFEHALVTALSQVERLRNGERISPDEWPKLRYNRDLL